MVDTPRSHWADRITAAVALIALGASFWSTQAQLDLTRQTLQLGQRPLLTIKPPTIEWRNDEQPVITFTWRNSGLGPARSVVVHYWMPVPVEADADTYSLQLSMQHGYGLSTPEFDAGPVGPGEDIIPTQQLLPFGEVSFFDPGRPILMTGMATYWDLFGKVYSTRYCLRFERRQITFCKNGSTSEEQPSGEPFTQY
ncbi:hypothetical protein K2Z84_32030 [Candidatus Binatia bacterium]|nr:hypothetical protein [Candidatus Binatia bacterium]